MMMGIEKEKNLVLIVNQKIDIYRKYAEQLLTEDKAYKCYMTAEELEAEREEQIANGLPPRYSGKHAHLTKEEQEAFEKEGRKPSIRIRVPQDRTYSFDDMVKGELSFEGHDFGDFELLKMMELQHIILLWQLMII